MTLRPLEARQFGTAAPSSFESALADALEALFAGGTHELGALVNALNESRVRPPDGGAWTEQKFRSILHELGR